MITFRGEQLAIVPLARPDAPTLLRHGGSGTTTYSYVVVARHTTGHSEASLEASVIDGVLALSPTDFIQITPPYLLGAQVYDIYRTAGGPNQGKLGSIVPVVSGSTQLATFPDYGQDADLLTPPDTNTTGLLYLPGIAIDDVLQVGADGLIVGTTAVSHVVTSTDLSDFPSDYTGHAFEVLMVNATEDGIDTAPLGLLLGLRSILTGTGLSGGGDLSGDLTLAVLPNTTVQKVIVAKAGTTIGTRDKLNLIEGSGVTLTMTDNSGADRVDVTVAAAGSSGTVTGTGTADVLTKWDMFGTGLEDSQVSDDGAVVAVGTLSAPEASTMFGVQGQGEFQGGILHGGSRAVKYQQRIHLTAAQLRTLQSAPVELVPDPGPGKMIVPADGSVWMEKYGTIPFSNPTSDPHVQFSWEGNAPCQASGFLLAPFIVNDTVFFDAVSSTLTNDVGSDDTSHFEHKALWLQAASDSNTGTILTMHVTNPGTGYAVNDEGSIFGGADGHYKVTTVGGGGTVTGVALLAVGTSGYEAGQTYSSAATTGSGTGLTLTVDTIIPADSEVDLELPYYVVTLP